MADLSRRLSSLDAFRGLTIAGMILVNSPGNDTRYWPLDHAEWNGLTPTDLVFPFFIFIVGVSLTLSLAKRMDRGDNRWALLRHVFIRSLLIFAIGLALNGFPHYALESIRILGVLQRIAICYFFGALLFLFANEPVQLVTAVALLGIYHYLLLHVGVPGSGVGNLSKEGNLAAYWDRYLLGSHTYRPAYDPEGLLSTLPAIASVLFGNLAGLWIRTTGSLSQKVKGFLQAGCIFLIIGMKWTTWLPLNKALWTSSYVMVTTALALLLLSLFIWAIEIRGWKRMAHVFEVFGLNALSAYIAHVFFLKLQNLIKLHRPDGSLENLRLFITDHAFRFWLSAKNASLAYALSYTLLWWLVFAALYRKRIFFKL